MDTLGKLKHIIDFLSFVAYNLKLETSLLCDQFALIPQPLKAIPKFRKIDLFPSLTDLQGLEMVLNQISDHYLTNILSCSPCITFTAPFVLLKKIDDIKAKRKLVESKRTTQSNENIKSVLRNEEDDTLKKRSLVEPESILYTQTLDKDTKSPGEDQMIISAIDSTRPISFASSFDKERADVEYLVEKAKISLDPFAHQHIVVLHSLICNKCVEPCQPPELQLIEYYHESDVTLGQYLEDLCYKINSSCSFKGCEEQLISHVKNYIHEGGGIKVSIEEMLCPNPGMEDIMLMWSTCKICAQSTPILPVSDNTWKYSFGKYLELSYYLPQMACRADICPHLITRDHIRRFGWKNILISIEYIPIQIFEISVPPLDLEIKSDVFIKLRQTDAGSLRLEIVAYFDSISERIQKFSYEILAVSKMQTAKEVMNELSKKCMIEKKFLLQLLQQTCVSTQAADLIAINNVRKVLKEKATSWDSEFDAFVRNFVQPEARDLRKITTVQLKKIFDMGKPDPELEDIQTISENYLPLLGSSPREGHLIVPNYEAFHPSRHRQLSVEIMANIRKLENRIHLPVFGSSPTNTLFLRPFFQEKVLINLSKPKSLINFSQLNLYDSEELVHGKFIVSIYCIEHSGMKKDVDDFQGQPEEKLANHFQHVSLALEEDATDWNNFTGVTVENEPISYSAENLGPGERNSIMKTLTNLWTGNQANLLPLEYPEYAIISLT